VVIGRSSDFDFSPVAVDKHIVGNESEAGCKDAEVALRPLCMAFSKVLTFGDVEKKLAKRVFALDREVRRLCCFSFSLRVSVCRERLGEPGAMNEAILLGIW